jgi:hypothetical protein
MSVAIGAEAASQSQGLTVESVHVLDSPVEARLCSAAGHADGKAHQR